MMSSSHERRDDVWAGGHVEFRAARRESQVVKSDNGNESNDNTEEVVREATKRDREHHGDRWHDIEGGVSQSRTPVDPYYFGM